MTSVPEPAASDADLAGPSGVPSRDSAVTVSRGGGHLALLGLLALILVFHLARADRLNRKEVTDLTTFYHSALAYRTGGNPYQIDEVRWPYLYPPTLLWLMAPLSLLPYPTAVLVWTAIGFGLWMLTAGMAQRLVRDGPPAGALLVIVPSLLAYRFVLRCSNFGQVDLLVVTLVTGCLALLAAGRPRLSGAVLALATAIKILPGLLVLLFFRRERWPGLAGFALGILLCLALPAVDPGAGRAAELIGQWRQGALWQHATDWSMANDPSNQSLSATMNRLLVTGEESHAGPRGRPLADIGLAGSRRLWTGLATLLCLVTIAVVVRRRPESFMPLEAASVILLTHLVSRKTWETHLVTLVLVNTILIGSALRWPSLRRLLGGAVAIAALLQNFYTPLLWGDFSDQLQYLGPTTLSLALLWVAVVTALRRNAAPGPAFPAPRALGLALLGLWIVFSGVRAFKESRHQANDFSTYYMRSADVRAGLDPYRLTEGQAPYIYPPLLLWLFTPLTFLPMGVAAVLWALIATLAMLGIVALCRGFPLGGRDPPSPRTDIAAVAGFLLAFRFVMREVSQGQVNALVVALTVGALALLLARRDALAGALLGFVTGVKILPAVFFMPLILWRRWRAALAMAVVIPVTLGLPVIGWGPATTGRVIEQWRGGQFLAHAQDLTLDVQAQNVSLWAWCRRTFSDVPATPPGKPPRSVNVASFSPRTTTWMYAILTLVLLSLSIRALARAAGPEAMVTGWALCWNLVHLVSKKSWEEHLVSLILILAVLVAWPGRSWSWKLPALLLWCHAPLLVGASLADTIQLYSPTTIALLVTFVSLLLRLEELGPEAKS